ncbi:NADPH-hemoprotein reductase [Aureococcus anophagefferens]|uniref:NADPH-hemoprotein reductase n=1 Tax=Aureococcus anophagefferens TaxID=44056 RepID=A0ABR1FHR9_AURAN
MGKDDPAKKGVCSNFICDSKPGDPIKMTGPSGKVMLMPEEKADTDYIMVATGTGIAPYRSFIRRLFTETTPAGEAYKGTAWLFLGVANSDALLYDEEWQATPPSAVMYFCGLKGMMPGIQDMLKGVCDKKGLDYDEYIKGLKKAGQWRVGCARRRLDTTTDALALTSPTPTDVARAPFLTSSFVM